MRCIFNISFNKEEIQEDWKNADNLPVPTKGKMDDTSNCRLVTSIFGKTLEHQKGIVLLKNWEIGRQLLPVSMFLQRADLVRYPIQSFEIIHFTSGSNCIDAII